MTHSSSDFSVVTETRTRTHAQTQSTKIQSTSNIEMFWPRKLILPQNQCQKGHNVGWKRCLLEVNKKVEGKGKAATTQDWPRRRREGYNSTLPLFSELNGGRWLTPRPGRFTPATENRDPLYRRLGGLPRPVWTDTEKSHFHRDSIPGPSSPQRVVIPTEPSRRQYIQ